MLSCRQQGMLATSPDASDYVFLGTADASMLGPSRTQTVHAVACFADHKTHRNTQSNPKHGASVSKHKCTLSTRCAARAGNGFDPQAYAAAAKVDKASATPQPYTSKQHRMPGDLTNKKQANLLSGAGLTDRAAPRGRIPAIRKTTSRGTKWSPL